MDNTFHINSSNIPYCALEEVFSPNVITASYLLISADTASIAPTNFTLLQLNSAPNNPARINIDTNNGSNSFGSSIRIRRNHGDTSHPGALLKDDSLMQLVGDGWNGALMNPGTVAINFFAEDNWTTSSSPTYITFKTAPSNLSGSAPSQERLKIDSSGSIIATGSITSLGGFLGTSSYSLTSSFSNTSSYLIYSSVTVQAPSGSTISLITVPNSIYNSMFVTYFLNDTQNFRAGNVVVLYTIQSAILTETSTTDIGDSSGLTISASLNASNVNLLAINGTTNNYTIKYHFDVL